MRTNILLDDKLTDEAFQLTGLKTKRELVDLALRELIQLKKKAKENGLCNTFEKLHKLKLSSDPFPQVERKNRPNPFADEI